MLATLKLALKLVLIPVLYFGGGFVSLSTIFKRAQWGLLLLIVLVPQPNVWYKFHPYPMGKDFLDILFISIVLGMIFQRKGFSRTNNTTAFILYIGFTYLSLWNSAIRFHLPVPITPDNLSFVFWKNYAQMICFYFLVLNVVKDEKDQKLVVTLMSLVVLFIAIRCYRNFSAADVFAYDKRVGGPFEIVGLGANHLGAFMAESAALFLGLFLFDRERRRRALFVLTCLFSLHPLFFSYSRGAYAAAFGALAWFGLIKKRTLLLAACLILVMYQTLLPASVVDRINMTETQTGQLEGSAEHRLDLWEFAWQLFQEHPVFGIGFDGFRYSVPQGELTDTHNLYMKALAESGVIGFIFLLVILLKAMASGWRLFRTGRTPFQQGLGFGFMGTVVACIIANLFGDRWSYFEMHGYFWIYWGLVDRGVLNAGQPARDTDESLKPAASPIAPADA